jgi:hypothetical protein
VRSEIHLAKTEVREELVYALTLVIPLAAAEARASEGIPLRLRPSELTGGEAKTLEFMVERKGIEPSTFALRTRRSPS